MNSPYNGKFKVTQEFKGKKHDGLDLVGLESKEVHSTVNGTVERASWENAKNKFQGFGLYVRIKKDGSVDKYYFGHLSKIKVRVGQKVKIGDVIGIEGSTGYSTGSHCHYCVRGYGLKSFIRDVSKISGIPNKRGIFDDGYKAEKEEKNSEDKKSNMIIAKEVLKGLWGNGSERKEKLGNAGYDYSAIQAEVNKLVGTSPNEQKKSDAEIAKEVIKGLWGNGAERKQRLSEAGYDYSAIQAEVNKLL